MSTYVLILIVGSYLRGMGVATAEFADQAACIEAGQAAHKIDSYVLWVCSPKATTPK